MLHVTKCIFHPVRLIDSFPSIFRVELPIMILDPTKKVLILDPTHVKLVTSPACLLRENLSISSSLIRGICYNLISHSPQVSREIDQAYS